PLRCARLVAGAALRAGPSCGLAGRAAPVPTRPPSLRTPVHYLSSRYKAAERGLLPELRGPPPHCGRNSLGGDEFTELGSEFGLRRVERADDVEPGIKGCAETCGVGAAIDRALCRVKGFG